MEITGRCFIAGEWTMGSGASFRAVSPFSGDDAGPYFREAGFDRIDRAMEAADAAFQRYSATTLDVRASFLRAIADELMALGELLLTTAHLETALPLDRLARERTRTVQQLRAFADHVEEGSWLDVRIDTAELSRVPSPKPDIRRMLVPLGPVVVFAASNFPFAFSVAGGDTASALAAGCSVVCKAHEAHPGTSELATVAIAQAALRSNVPAAVFSMLQGRSHEVGLTMVRHPAVRAVGFTGSLRAGRIIFDEAGARPDPIPVYAEMGSVNPIFVLPQALATRAESIADGIAHAALLDVGQFCTSPGVVIAVRGEGFDLLCNRLSAHIGAAASGTMLRPSMRTTFRDAVHLARKRGAEQLALGQPAADADALTVQPVLLSVTAEQFLSDASLQQEVFGPLSIIVRCASMPELMRVAQGLDGQLTATVHGASNEVPAQWELMQVLQHKAGRVIANGYPTGVEFGHAIHHGGPFPASTDARSTAIGSAALQRFTRPVCFQNFPQALLPEPARDSNSHGIWRTINGALSRSAVHS